jgi:hypothetical protein
MTSRIAGVFRIQFLPAGETEGGGDLEVLCKRKYSAFWRTVQQTIGPSALAPRITMMLGSATDAITARA